MQRTHMLRLGAVAFALAWCFDQLFWQKQPGISFLIFVLLCLGVGYSLTWGEKLRPAPPGLLLLIPILFFAGMSAWRQEPFSLLLDYGLTLGCMAILSFTWLGGSWWRYNVGDYVLNALRWIGDMLVRPVRIFAPEKENPDSDPERDIASSAMSGVGLRRRRWRTVLSVLLGLLLAFPVVVLLASLLAQADPIFDKQLANLLKLIDLEKLDEYMFRLFYISIAAYLLSGVFLHALLSSEDERVSAGDKAWLPPFVGWVISATLLACVDLLYAFFVLVQFRYFFGGQANIHLEGFTYSEYARRGFGELVAVAVISLLLLLLMNAVTRRESSRSRWTFSVLGIVLVSLVAVILVSAFQRLLLYEAAYGFTRLRAYTHVFMIWVGVLLLLTAALEAAGRMRHFALVAVLAGLGFGASLNLLNVDSFIVRQNVQRVVQGTELDRAYLVSLSDDAVPALYAAFDAPALTQHVRDQLGAALACRATIQQKDDKGPPWPSFNWSTHRALRLSMAHQDQLVAYPVRRVNGVWKVKVNGLELSCLD